MRQAVCFLVTLLILFSAIGYADSDESTYIIKTEVFKDCTTEKIVSSPFASTFIAIGMACNEYDSAGERIQFSKDFRERFIFGILQCRMRVFISKFDDSTAIVWCISDDYIYLIAIPANENALVVQCGDGVGNKSIDVVVKSLEDEYGEPMHEIELSDCEDIVRVVLK